MAWDVCQVGEEQASLSLEETGAGQSRVTKQITRNYRAIASGYSAGTDVDCYLATKASGVPVIGQSIYVNPDTGKIWPYWTCKSVQAQRSKHNAFHFEIQAVYSDPTGQENEQDPPNDPEEIEAILEYDVETIDVGIWIDTANDPVLLPTGNLYSDPVLKPVSVLIIKLTQYHSSFTKDNLRSRNKLLNSSTWNGFAPGQAKIDTIDWTPNVLVPLAVGTFATAQKVTYTIKCLKHTFEILDDAGETQDEQLTWDPWRIQNDTAYLAKAGNLRSKRSLFTNEFSTLSSLYLRSNGTPHPWDKQFGVPPQKEIRAHDRNSFSFLRLPPGA